MPLDTLTLDENNEGDLFLEIPDELLDTLGWEDGTEVEWTVVGDSIRISKVVPGRSGVAGDVSVIQRGDGAVDSGDGDVVGDPSF